MHYDIPFYALFPLGYVKGDMGSKNQKFLFDGRYCTLQSWPDFSGPTVAISYMALLRLI